MCCLCLFLCSYMHMFVYVLYWYLFFFSSRRRHTRCALVTGVQTCALPILIGARGRLVDPLAEQRHGARVRDEQLVELPEVGGGDVAGARDRPEVISLTKLVPEIGGHRDVCGEISVVDHIRLAAMLEQAIHQRDVAAGPDREVKVGFFGGLGPARIEDRKSTRLNFRH